MMISTRRFCGSRTPGPVGTSRCVSPKPWMVIALRRHAILDQFGLHRLGAAHRQALVVLRRARRIGVAVHLDPRVLHLGRVVRRFPDDLARAIGERRLVPIEEHQVGAGRCRRRNRRRSRRRRRRDAEVVAQAEQDRVVVGRTESDRGWQAAKPWPASVRRDRMAVVGAVPRRTEEAVLGRERQARRDRASAGWRRRGLPGRRTLPWCRWPSCQQSLGRPFESAATPDAAPGA